MDLDDFKESSHVEDRRSSRGGFGGGVSMRSLFMLAPIIRMLLKTKFGWAIIGVGAFLYFSGFNPLSQAGGSSKVTADDEKKAVFIKKVLATTEDIWGQILPKYGIRYKKPNLVLYRGKTTSGCGFASAQMGPFYCPADQKVYLDLGFFDELARRHNSPGDFAQAYVLAHEIGHHIQNMQGTLQKVQQVQQRFGNSPKANALQVRVELQADCYSGVWAHHAQKRFRVLEPGDINEALRAASSIGDDTLQKEAQGYVVPDSFTHGSSQQRVEWFKRGFISGDLRSCNTFN
jgi:predicted metalloprotease